MERLNCMLIVNLRSVHDPGLTLWTWYVAAIEGFVHPGLRRNFRLDAYLNKTLNHLFKQLARFIHIPPQNATISFLNAIRPFLTMIVERASHKLAYLEDIPGSRCGPEDGPWPRSYQVLSEKDVWRELRILAKPQSTQFDPEGRYKADSINFQPSPTTKTQDRYVVTQLEVHGRRWSFTGVFDGTYALSKKTHH